MYQSIGMYLNLYVEILLTFDKYWMLYKLSKIPHCQVKVIIEEWRELKHKLP